jgi:hypothetical protein
MKPKDILRPYITYESKRRYKKLISVPIPLEARMKATILAMRDGQWYTMWELQKITGLGRKRIRNLMKKFIAMGAVEKYKSTGNWYWSTENKWKVGYKYNRHGVFFRMDISKLNITVTQENTPPE